MHDIQDDRDLQLLCIKRSIAAISSLGLSVSTIDIVARPMRSNHRPSLIYFPIAIRCQYL